jgi:6-phospho-beta-galactosidase
MNKMKFGTATAAFQCEGNLETHGRGKCVWDDVLINNKSIAKYHPEPASEFYTKYAIDFDLANQYGIEPNITLHHFDSPQWFVEKGDFLSKENIKYFLEYADFCFKEFSEITYWATINEINAYSEQKCIKAALPPFFTLEYGQFFKQQYNMVLAHSKAVNLFKEKKI